MNFIDREGIFRGPIVEAMIVTGKESQSVGLNITARIDEALNGKAWDDWSQYAMHAYGTLWVIKKDGSINEQAAESARDVLGWDGNVDSIDAAKLSPCQFNVKPDTYNNKTTYKIAWVNPWDYEGGMQPLDPSALAQIKTMHGAKLRAFFGVRKSGSQAPPPSAPPKSPPPVGHQTESSGSATRDEAWAAALETCKGDEKKALVHWDKNIKVREEMVGKGETDFTPNDWAAVRDDCQIPF